MLLTNASNFIRYFLTSVRKIVYVYLALRHIFLMHRSYSPVTFIASNALLLNTHEMDERDACMFLLILAFLFFRLSLSILLRMGVYLLCIYLHTNYFLFYITSFLYSANTHMSFHIYEFVSRLSSPRIHPLNLRIHLLA